MSKIWFITGASSGFGKALAEAVLARGDSAVLTARRLEPAKAMQVVIDMVEGDSAPVRLMLGEDAYQLWESAAASRNRDLAVWRARGEDKAIPGAAKNPVEAL